VIFAVLNLEPPDGPFADAIDRIARVRKDLQLHPPEHLTDPGTLGAKLRSLRERGESGASDERGSFLAAPSPVRSPATDGYVFIDGEVASAGELYSALATGLVPRPDDVPRVPIHLSVLVHSQEFSEDLKRLVDRCEHELDGLFEYRVLSELSYGITKPGSRRLQYAIESLFSTNWTRLARDPAELSEWKRSRPGPPPNHRLEPFDDHGPFLSQQIHDLGQIIAISTLGSFSDALTAMLTRYATPEELSDLPANADLSARLEAWRTTADFGRRYRRFRRVLQLYGKIAPSLDDETIAYFDGTKYPAWLDPTTLQVVPGGSLEAAIEEFVKSLGSSDPDAQWGLHWLRAADGYLRRLREQVIT
jgi:hypothetical protein